MTWQEELRQLDSALAGGELSANEYRKRRDEILAAASSAQPPSPVIGPPTGPRPAAEAEKPTGGDTDDSEVTQIVNVDSGNGNGNGGSETGKNEDAESTQIISDPAKNGVAAAEKTQIVATEERPAPALDQPKWAALPPTQNASTTMFPPLPPPPPVVNTVTPLDAQDLFTSNKPARGGGKPWLIAVVGIVVLALVGGAVWWFAFRNDDSPTAANSGDEQTTEPAGPKNNEPPKPVDITKIDMPGDPATNTGAMDITKAGELKVIAPAEAALLADSGVNSLVYAGSSAGNYRFLLYSYESDSPASAAKMTDAVAGVQQQMGLKPMNINGVEEDVQVTGLTNSSAAVLRGVYTYGNTTIQLSVLQVPVGDAAELATQFSTAMKTVTDAAPPTA
jgi:hypothetical protein